MEPPRVGERGVDWRIYIYIYIYISIVRLGGGPLCRYTSAFSVQPVPRGLLPARVRPQGVFNCFRGCRAPPFVDPVLGGRHVRRSAAGLPRGGGGVSGDPNIPQSDPHDALIVLNVHKWGKNCFQKKLPINSGPHQPRSDPEVGSGSKSFFVLFIQRHHSSGSDCASAPELHRPPL